MRSGVLSCLNRHRARPPGLKFHLTSEERGGAPRDEKQLLRPNAQSGTEPGVRDPVTSHHVGPQSIRQYSRGEQFCLGTKTGRAGAWEGYFRLRKASQRRGPVV